MKLQGEVVGTFIDAVYAIAVTILALEIPQAMPGSSIGAVEFLGLVLEYGVAFVLLFAFWIQHRRVNGLVEYVERSGLFVNGLVLMTVCLVPRATTLVFELGGDVTMDQLGETILGQAGWTTAEEVDLLYVALVVGIDLGILLLLRLSHGESTNEEAMQLHRNKRVTSVLLLSIIGISFLLPIENRYFLLVIPVALFFENEMSRGLSPRDGAG